MKASEVKAKLALIPDDYVYADDFELHGFIMNHDRKEFTTTAYSEEEAADMIKEFSEHYGKMEFV